MFVGKARGLPLHFSLLQKSINYGRKKFYSTGPELEPITQNCKLRRTKVLWDWPDLGVDDAAGDSPVGIKNETAAEFWPPAAENCKTTFIRRKNLGTVVSGLSHNFQLLAIQNETAGKSYWRGRLSTVDLLVLTGLDQLLLYWKCYLLFH
jgi:hypothetical protein